MDALAPAGQTAAFDTAYVAYRFGALIVISAMGFFMTRPGAPSAGLDSPPLPSPTASCSGRRRVAVEARAVNPRWPALHHGGIDDAAAVYGIQDVAGLWPEGDPGAYRDYYTHVRGSWIIIDSTIGVGTSAIARGRFRS